MLIIFNFNPRSPQGERQYPYVPTGVLQIFQPTFPPRGTAIDELIYYMFLAISTHVPPKGNGDNHFIFIYHFTNFNPRSPQGERHSDRPAAVMSICISTHVPPKGNGPIPQRSPRPISNFNPRSPQGERLCYFVYYILFAAFQPTFPPRGTASNIPNIITQNNHIFVSFGYFF